MIGLLPSQLEVEGKLYDINSDFRIALLIMQMYNDKALSAFSKQKLMLELIYSKNIDGEVIVNIPHNIEEAIKKATTFLNIGENEKGNSLENGIRTIDYKQDEQMLFSAVNAVFSKEVRAEPYMHWWTFYGLCQAIDENSLLSSVVSIRTKKGKGIKLDEHEKRFYAENKDLIDIDGASILDKGDNVVNSMPELDNLVKKIKNKEV